MNELVSERMNEWESGRVGEWEKCRNILFRACTKSRRGWQNIATRL